jgi:mono/diheme cytochrome c family protein
MLNSIRRYSYLLIVSTLLLVAPPTKSNAQDVEEGARLFQIHCSSCHQVGRERIGPDLKGVNNRLNEDWLIPFIQNSQEVIQAGDEYAVQIYEQYNRTLMPAVNLTDGEVRSVLAYIENETEKLEEAVAIEAADPTAVKEDTFLGLSQDTALILLSIIMAILVIALIILIIIKVNLEKLVWNKENPEEKRPLSLPEFVYNGLSFMVKRVNPVLAGLTVTLILVVMGMTYIWSKGQYTGSQKGYAPEQPIPFDHVLHAGVHEIDCQYCHTGVESGASANIPALNICMNCHVAVRDESPDVQKIVEAYNNNTPIEWVRIHNLADHVYFNHAQHVKVANIDCETCHGDVATMNKVGQVRHMTMGWCINCHRETEVDFSNEYYHKTFSFLEDHEGLTISQLGGLECSKCHY